MAERHQKHVYLSKITTPIHPSSTANFSCDIAALPRAFLCLLDKSDLFTEGAINAYLMMDNKEDTLMQSQMLWANENAGI
jgi:hypothetical protein